MKCHNCNFKNDADAKFCENCGNALQAEKPAAQEVKTAKRPCSNCGTVNRAGVRFCENCGNALDAQKVAKVEAKPARQACSNCGTVNRGGTRFCETCGTPLGVSQPASKSAPQSRTPQPPKPRNAGAGIAGVFAGGMIALVCFVLVFAFSQNNRSSQNNTSYDEPYSQPQSNQNPSNPSNPSSPSNPSNPSQGNNPSGGNNNPGGSSSPSVYIDPPEGTIPTTYYVTLSGFDPGETVHLEVYSLSLGATVFELDVDTDSNGEGAAKLTSDSSDTPGTFRVYATGSRSGSEASEEFVISGQGQTAGGGDSGNPGNVQVVDDKDCVVDTKNLRLSLSPGEGAIGEPYKLCMGGFSPNETVSVSVATSYPLELQKTLSFNVNMNSNGWGAVAFTPDDLDGFATGPYSISAEGQQSGLTGRIETFFGMAGNSKSTYKADIAWFEEIMDEYWRQTFPQIWASRSYETPETLSFIPPIDFKPCPNGIVNPQTTKNGAWACGAIPDNVIFWDDQWVLEYYTHYGSVTTFVVLAHEWGHRALRMARIDLGDANKQEELIADCLAGSAYAYVRNQHGLFYDDDTLVAFYFIGNDLADNYLSAWSEEDPNFGDLDRRAHGTQLERRFAFLSGYNGGPVDGCSLVPQP